MADHGTGHIHGRIPHADNRHPFSQIVGVRIRKIVDGIVYISKGFPLDAQGLRPPDSGSDKDALVSVPEQIFNLQRRADGRVGPDLHANLQQLLLIAVQDRLRQTERGDSILKDASDLILRIEDGDTVALLCQQDSDGNSGRACADNRNLLSIFRLTLNLHLIKNSIGNVIFNAADMDRLSFSAEYAVALTLIFMITYQRAD